MYHAQYGHSQGEDSTFVCQCVIAALHLEYFQSLGGVVELLIGIEIEDVVAKNHSLNFANTLLVNDNIVWIEGIVQKFQFADVTHGQNDAAQNGHDLFVGELLFAGRPALDLFLEGVCLPLKILDDLILFGADIGLREYLVVMCVEVELMLEGHISPIFPNILVHQLFAGKGVLNSNHLLVGRSVQHKVPSVWGLFDESVVLKFASGDRTVWCVSHR